MLVHLVEHVARITVCVVTLLLTSGCDINVGGPTVTNTNTNTNTNSVDVHDAVNFVPAQNPAAPVPSPTGGTELPVAIPFGSQGIAQAYAAANAGPLSHSCETVFGAAAWQFLDGLVATLKASDPRWGYLVKTTGAISHDVIAYRATSDNVGAFGVDVIVDYCGASTFAWNVIGFDPAAVWTANR